MDVQDKESIFLTQACSVDYKLQSHFHCNRGMGQLRIQPK